MFCWFLKVVTPPEVFVVKNEEIQPGRPIN